MSEIAEITPHQAQELLQGDYQLIDVREADEYAAVHAKNAVNIPLSELESRFQEIAKDKPAILICRIGGRSMRAAEFLAANGFEAAQLYNLGGGTEAWVAADLPHQTETQAGEQ